jgi:monoterpene epsilon-lactone hydrolase
VITRSLYKRTKIIHHRWQKMVSKGMKRVIKVLKQNAEKDVRIRVEQSRKGLEQLASLVKLSEDVSIENIKVDDMAANWISTPKSNREKIVLYLHGGGYMEGSLKSHQDLAIRIAQASKTRVLLIDYRLAPEHPFPAALDDTERAYKWLLEENNGSPKNIAIAGDSAGGGLILCTLIKLRDEGIALPAAAVCLSPWTDLAMTGESIKANAKIDPWMKPSDLYFMAELYIGDNDPRNPLISPIYGKLKGLPPILIHVGSAEILLDDSIRLAEKAKFEGVDVSIEIWDEMLHVFQAFADWAPEGQEAINKIGTYIQSKLFS